MGIIPSNIFANVVVALLSFIVLTRSANYLVDGSVGIAYNLKVPKIIIGIVLVSLATTAPEFTVSVLSSLRGKPEIALGNALGSVIADDALALALGVIVAPVAIKIHSRVLKSAGFFLIGIDLLAFFMSLSGTISRLEGGILISVLVGYLVVVVISEKRRRNALALKSEKEVEEEVKEHIKPGPMWVQFLRFAGGVAGVLVASEFLIDSSVFIARYIGVSEAVIGLTMIAIGTSLPEIATCVVSARRGYGDLAVGDIIGADILNILWIVGTAALVNPITVARKIIYFAFPAMIVTVSAMLLLMRLGYKLQRWKGFVLLSLYIVYLGLMGLFFVI